MPEIPRKKFSHLEVYVLSRKSNSASHTALDLTVIFPIDSSEQKSSIESEPLLSSLGDVCSAAAVCVCKRLELDVVLAKHWQAGLHGASSALTASTSE
jgi:hypothetical protein